VVDDVTRQIDARLAVLREEMSRLEKARAALTGTSTTTTRRASAGRTRRRSSGSAGGTGTGRRGRPRGSGTRAKEALALVQKQPGITIPELADKMGIKQNYLYRVMPTLAGEGQVSKKDKGWHPVA
jgi:CRP-like cAMP-binding protein